MFDSITSLPQQIVIHNINLSQRPKKILKYKRIHEIYNSLKWLYLIFRTVER